MTHVPRYMRKLGVRWLKAHILYRAVALCTSLIALVFLTSSCDSTPPRPIHPERFLPVAEQGTKSGQTERQPPISIYVDGSGSMRGFASDPTSNYLNVLRVLLGKSVGSYDAQIYKFTTNLTSVGSMAFGQMQMPGFYKGSWTPLTELFARIVKEHKAGPRISVLVSDLVESEESRDYTDLMRELRQLSELRQEILLLAFKSRFEDEKYETQTRPRKKIKIDTNNRPFFVLIVAPDRGSLLQFRRDVLHGLSELHQFYPSHPLGSISAVKYAPNNKDKRTWNLHKTMELNDALSGPKRLLAYFRDRDVHRAEQGPLQIELAFDGNMELKDPSAVSFSIAKGSFADSGIAEKKNPGITQTKPNVVWKPIKVKALFSRKPSRMTATTSMTSLPVNNSPGVLAAGPSDTKGSDASGGALSTSNKLQVVFLTDYYFPRPANNSWDIYRIQLRPGQGNLAAPVWVETLSTHTDQSPEQGDRTLHLDFFVEALLKGVAEDLVFSEQYFLLGRGKQ